MIFIIIVYKVNVFKLITISTFLLISVTQSPDTARVESFSIGGYINRTINLNMNRFNHNIAMCSAGKCRIAGKRHNLRKMSQRRREMSQSAENVVNPTAGICRIVDGKCRKKIRCQYMSQHRREMSQLLLLLLHLDNLLKRKQQVIKYTCI